MIMRAIGRGLAAALLAFAAGSVAAKEPEAAAFAKAIASLDARLGPVETGPAIDTTDAAANAADIAVIEKAMGALGTPAWPIEGLATFDSVCSELNRLSVRHLLDGIAAIARPPGSPPPTPEETRELVGKVQALQLRNSARYPDAMAVLGGSAMRCMVRHFPAMTEYLAGVPAAELTPTRLKGADTMRRGAMQALLGYSQWVRDPAISPANKARLTAYVAEVAAPLAATLTPPLRAELAGQLASLPPTADPDVLATTALLASALAITTCEGLCRY
jgi:hypothetical protein